MNKRIPRIIATGVVIILTIVVGGIFWLNNKEVERISTPAINQLAVKPSCEELNVSQEQIDSTVAESISDIHNSWGNESDFQLLIDRIEAKLGCAVDKNSITSAKQPTPITPSNLDNWSTYRNDEYGFEFKYPKDFIKQKVISKNDLLYLQKDEIGSNICISASIRKDYQVDRITSSVTAEEVNIDGKNGYKYYYREGAGYSGVFLLQLKNDTLQLTYDHIGSGKEEASLENLVPNNFEEIISTFKFTK